MPAPDVGRKRLWRYMAADKLGGNDQLLIERSRACPECPRGEMDRLAERQFHAPYRWVPIGYICNKCGLVVIAKDTHV